LSDYAIAFSAFRAAHKLSIIRFSGGAHPSSNPAREAITNPRVYQMFLGSSPNILFIFSAMLSGFGGAFSLAAFAFATFKISSRIGT
jgi:hypothetical protein